MGCVAWTIERLVGSLAERNLTRAPLNMSPKEAVAERPGRANATCGACGYKKTTERGKTHYIPNCTMEVGNVQCVAALPKGHEFHTGAKCSALKGLGKDPSVQSLFGYIHRHFCLQLLTEVISAFRDFAIGCNEVFQYYSAAKEVWKAAFLGISDGMKCKIYLPWQNLIARQRHSYPSPMPHHSSSSAPARTMSTV